MKTNLALLSMLLFTWTSLGQNPGLSAFVVYESCTHGLKNSSGKIVWKAELEELTPHGYVDDKYANFAVVSHWLAKKEGYYGMIDQVGKLIIPFNYVGIVRYQKEKIIIARRNDRIDFYDDAGHLLQSVSGFNEIYAKPHGYLTQKERKYGFLDTNFREVLPALYDRVNVPIVASSAWVEGGYIYSDRYLQLEQDGFFGYFDRYRQSMVVPIEYSEHKPIWIKNDCESSSAVFQVYKSGIRGPGLINETGKLLVQPGEVNYLNVMPVALDDCGKIAQVTAYLPNGSKTMALNARTGQQSQEYDELVAIGARSVFRDGKEWGVLDSNFQEMKRFSRYSPTNLGMMSFENNFLHQVHASANEFKRSHSGFEWNDGVLLIVDTTEVPRKSDYHVACMRSLGMFHYESGKKINPRYRSIHVYRSGNRKVIWAENGIHTCQELDVQYESIDIYDEKLNLIKRIKHFVELPEYEMDSGNLYLTINSNELYGASNIWGEEIIPVEYDSYAEIKMSGSETRKEVLYLFEKENRWFVFDATGELVFPEGFQGINCKQNVFFASTTDGVLQCLDRHGTVLLENYDEVISAPKLDNEGNCFAERKSGDYAQQSIYVLKENKVYIVENETLLLVDSQTFQFEENYLLFAPRHAIDKQGALVKLNFPHKYIPAGQCSIRFNDPEELKMEAPKPQQNSSFHQPEPPKFVWKSTNDRTTNGLKWQVYHSNGRIVHNQYFDYPVDVSRPQKCVFHTNGKFGVFDENYQIVMEPEYDYIYPYKGYLLLKDSSWYWFNKFTGTTSGPYDAISVFSFGDKQFVYKSGKIGVIDDSLRMVIPFTDSLNLVKNWNLSEFLNVTNYSNTVYPASYIGLTLGVKPEKIYREQNNALLLELAWESSTAVESMHFDPVDHRFMASSPENVKFYVNPSPHIHQHKVYMATDQVYTRETRLYERKMNWDLSCYERKSYNYRIVNNEFILLNHTAVFKTDEISSRKLDELLLREINKTQAFGQHCTDLPDKLRMLKDNFMMTKYCVRFTMTGYNKLEIELSYADVKTLLKDPQLWINLKGK